MIVLNLEQELRQTLEMARKAIKEAQENNPDYLSPIELQEKIAYFSRIEKVCQSILSKYFDAA